MRKIPNKKKYNTKKKKKKKESRLSKPVSNAPLWPLLQLLPPHFCPA